MTRDEQEKFNKMAAEIALTAEQIKQLEEFIFHVSDAAFDRGIAEGNYANAMSYMDGAPYL